MTARVTIGKNYNFKAIALTANQPPGKIIHYAKGVLYVDGVSQADLEAAVVIVGSINAIDFEKELAKNTIDEVAGVARKKYLTTSDGQAMTYLKKEADAEAFKAAGYPEVDINDYPWIQAESVAQNDTGQQATDMILAQRDAWLVVGVAIEEARMQGKVQVDQQLGLEGINTAKDNAITALELI